MCVKLLTEQHLEFLSLRGGCTGSSESTLVKMPHCQKSHVMAHIRNLGQWLKLSCIFQYAKYLEEHIMEQRKKKTEADNESSKKEVNRSLLSSCTGLDYKQKFSA